MGKEKYYIVEKWMLMRENFDTIEKAQSSVEMTKKYNSGQYKDIEIIEVESKYKKVSVN